MLTLTVIYRHPHTLGHQRREYRVADMTPETIDAVIDLFDGQIGTVLYLQIAGRTMAFRPEA